MTRKNTSDTPENMDHNDESNGGNTKPSSGQHQEGESASDSNTAESNKVQQAEKKNNSRSAPVKRGVKKSTSVSTTGGNSSKAQDKSGADVIDISDYLYYTECDTVRIIENLNELKQQIYPEVKADGEANARPQPFPSVCLIGLGRCGSNISLDLAMLVHNARQFYLDDTQRREASEKDTGMAAKWIRKNFHLPPKNSGAQAFLIEPLIMLGDLDKDINGRIKSSYGRGENNLLDNYKKMKVMDLSEVHAGGAGNAPILGQYLAKMILNRGTEQFLDENWKNIHSYLIDSCGIKANQSRLFFYIFSAGGGTGSGMASEFGLAQQYAYMSKTFNDSVWNKQGVPLTGDHSFVFEPIFSTGICILPNLASESSEISEALHINSGRLLCKYLSEEWNFSYNNADEDGAEKGIMERLRPWNAMMLISNDIMRYAEESNDGDIKNIDVNTMEKYANQYISQQIFNILTAQSVTTDYDQDYFRRAGIDINETIRLDANDLFMSLAGPVTIAYAEAVVSKTSSFVSESSEQKQKEQEVIELDVDDLFFRSIDLPHFNDVTKAIEGVSLLPIESKRYREYLKDCKANNYNTEKLKKLHFFNQCSSIVSIISLPKDYKLSYMDLNKLKKHLNNIFPNTTLKRYALVIGTSSNVSLTTLIAKSPCLSDDFLTLIVSYIKRCFGKGKYRYDDSFDRAFLSLIRDEVFDDEHFNEMVDEFENPAKILDTNWNAIKPMYEKKYRETIEGNKKFVSINDIRLSSEDIKGTIMYLREIYRHRISKTKIVSLNDPDSDTKILGGNSGSTDTGGGML